MPKRLDLTGQKFARLTVKNHSHNADGKSYWICKCECGNFTTKLGSFLKSGYVKSCGCLHRDSCALVGRSKRTHGLTGTYHFTVLNEVKRKCDNPNHHSYWSHGAKGITVCARWLESLDNFIEDMGERPTNKHCLILKVDAKEFNKENCFWGTVKQKCRQSRQIRPTTYKGVTKPLVEWAEELNLDIELLRNRASSVPPWSDEDILTKPIKRNESQRLRAAVKKLTKDL